MGKATKKEPVEGKDLKGLMRSIQPNFSKLIGKKLQVASKVIQRQELC